MTHSLLNWLNERNFHAKSIHTSVALRINKEEGLLLREIMAALLYVAVETPAMTGTLWRHPGYQFSCLRICYQ